MGNALMIPVLGTMLVLSACAPSPAADQARTPDGGQSERSRAPKMLTLAVVAEPSGLHADLSAGLTGGGNKQAFLIVHNYLVVRNASGARLPQLAEELISLEKGTWRVNPDGTMDTIWKIRPNVKWHDGASFTTDDLLFSFNVYKDSAIAVSGTGSGTALKAMATAEVTDPRTFAVHWSSTFVDADWALGLIPMPRHLLEEEFLRDKANFVNSPRFGAEFVGLGPYRLTKWDPRVQMEFVRFDEYFLGRPPLDGVTLRFLGDTNTMVSSILAEGVDVVLPLGVDAETAVEVRRRWTGTGHQVTIPPIPSLRYLQIQHRAEYARPRNGLTNRLVRQAFYHATDRQAAADVAMAGTAPISDSWFPPSHELYAEVRASIPQYSFDLNRATQLLAQAGWVRGTDGLLVSQPGGNRFEIELRDSQDGSAEKRTAPVADTWKRLGAEVDINIVPAALSDPEYRVTYPGASITGNVADSFLTNVLHSKDAAGAANRWVGANRAGYANPAVDAILEQLVATIAPSERLALHREMLKEALGDVAFIPLYFLVSPVLALKGVHGVGGYIDNANTWNIFEWTKD